MSESETDPGALPKAAFAGTKAEAGQVLRARVLVLKGGNAKSLAFVGAIETLFEYGATFHTFVGTSAGAVTAALLAAEMTPRQIEQIVGRDLSELLDHRGTRLHQWLAGIFRGWIHSGQLLRQWLRQELLEHWKRYNRDPNRGDPVRLGDLRRRLITVSVSRKAGRCLFDSAASEPKDSHGSLDLADVVYGSTAICGFFKPVQLADGQYDDGALAKFPLEELIALAPDEPFLALCLSDDKTRSRWPRIFGRRGELGDVAREQPKPNHAARLEKCHELIIHIDPSPIQSFDFSLGVDEKKMLRACGRLAVLRHLAHYAPSLGVAAASLATAMNDVDEARSKIVEARRLKAEMARTTRGRFALLSVVLFGLVALAVAHASGVPLGSLGRAALAPRAGLFKLEGALSSYSGSSAGPAAIIVGSSTFVNYLACAGFDWERKDILLLEAGSETGKEILTKASFGGANKAAQARLPVLAIASEPLDWCGSATHEQYQSDLPQKCDAGGNQAYFRIKLSDRGFHALRVVQKTDGKVPDKQSFDELVNAVIDKSWVYSPGDESRKCLDRSSQDPQHFLACLSNEGLARLVDKEQSPAVQKAGIALYAPGGSSGTRVELLDIGSEFMRERHPGMPWEPQTWEWRKFVKWNLRLETIPNGSAIAVGSENSFNTPGSGFRRTCLAWTDETAADYRMKTYRLCRPDESKTSCTVYNRVYSIYGRLPSAESGCRPAVGDTLAGTCSLPVPVCKIVKSMLQAASEREGKGSIAQAQLDILADRCEFVRASPNLVMELPEAQTPKKSQPVKGASPGGHDK